LWILVFSVLGPQFANQLGWFAAEVGRQPWIVQGLLRTSDALSKKVQSDQILASLILFALVYFLLFVLFIFLLDRKIKQGPLDVDLKEALRIRTGTFPPLTGPRAEGI
jgi:cytochrome d ubiquinol oxidase subunit I